VFAFPDFLLVDGARECAIDKDVVEPVDLSNSQHALVSLVSVWGRNWCYLCGRIERVETGEIVEIANIHAVFMHVAEKMAA
jgi:hypothetical protein